ncbi:MAG: hypothetical protein ABIR25_06140 [Sphingomicrobium sp.]
MSAIMAVFSRIAAFVDRDIASNGKPISLIGMGIPFVPFMLFVDGAPADSYPVLGGLALAISLGWGLFVMWRLLRHLKVEMRPHKQQLGPLRFWLLLAGTFLAIALLAAILMWLDQ